MRQVPRYAIIGDGKMASHFCHYLTLLRVPFVQWSRKQSKPLNIPCETVLLLISDSAIENFIAENPCLKNKILIHFSGALCLEGVYGAHPLMSFTDNLYDLNTYKNISFILDQDRPDFLFPELPNNFFKIPRELKPYYHALCVLSGNFTCILWHKFFSELEKKLNIPKEAGFSYLNQIIKNIMHNPSTALTGPLARRDHKTIQANLTALQNDNFKSLYEEFVKL